MLRHLCQGVPGGPQTMEERPTQEVRAVVPRPCCIVSCRSRLAGVGAPPAHPSCGRFYSHRRPPRIHTGDADILQDVEPMVYRIWHCADHGRRGSLVDYVVHTSPLMSCGSSYESLAGKTVEIIVRPPLYATPRRLGPFIAPDTSC